MEGGGGRDRQMEGGGEGRRWEGQTGGGRRWEGQAGGTSAATIGMMLRDHIHMYIHVWSGRPAPCKKRKGLV